MLHIGLAPQTWRLNDALLTDPVITAQIAVKLVEYFRMTDVEDTSPPILWAAHKVVLRGHLIELATARKRERGAKVATLTRELHQIYYLHHQSHSPEILKQIDSKRVDFIIII